MLELNLITCFNKKTIDTGSIQREVWLKSIWTVQTQKPHETVGLLGSGNQAGSLVYPLFYRFPVFSALCSLFKTFTTVALAAAAFFPSR